MTKTSMVDHTSRPAQLADSAQLNRVPLLVSDLRTVYQRHVFIIRSSGHLAMCNLLRSRASLKIDLGGVGNPFVLCLACLVLW